MANTSSEKADGDLKGFDRGLKAEKILGATNSKGELSFLMKWKGTKIVEMVPAKEANIICPQVVIAFYENHIKWLASSDSDDNEDKKPVCSII